MNQVQRHSLMSSMFSVTLCIPLTSLAESPTPMLNVEVTNHVAHPVPVEIVNGVEVTPQIRFEARVVGFAETVTDGRIETTDSNGNTIVGYAAANRRCRQVALNARMATPEEWVNTPDKIYPEDFTAAWLRPHNIRILEDPEGGADTDWVAFFGDFSDVRVVNRRPIRVRRELSCRDYTSTNVATGLSGTTDGLISRTRCKEHIYIACANEVAVPTLVVP